MSELLNEVRNGPVHLQIGKNGVTEGVTTHLQNLLKQNKILKVKILKEIVGEVGVDSIIEAIIQQLKIYVVDVRGFTVLFSKRKLKDIHYPKKYFLMTSEILGKNQVQVDDDKSKETEKLPKKQEAKPVKDKETQPQFSKKDVFTQNIPSEEYIDYSNELEVAEIDREIELMYNPPKENPSNDKPKSAPPQNKYGKPLKGDKSRGKKTSSKGKKIYHGKKGDDSKSKKESSGFKKPSSSTRFKGKSFSVHGKTSTARNQTKKSRKSKK